MTGIGFLLLAILINSLQNVAVKWIGGNYSVLEIVAFRSLIALPCTLLLYRYEGRRGLPTTKQPKRQTLRGIFLFLSYTTHMMGVAALPLADVESIRFSGPLMITILSVFLLGEKVELRRWLALLVGFVGVMLIIRPSSANFNVGTLFILISVLFYALTVMITRTLRTTESSATMAYYSSLVYLVAAFVLSPLAAAFGKMPLYHFGYKSEMKIPGTEVAIGTPHAMDITFKFNNETPENGPGFLSGNHPDRFIASHKMAELWATFARTGKPAAADVPEWPAYTLADRATLRIDTHCTVMRNRFNEELALWRAIDKL